ncbi:MAG TPA: chromate resistance protein ChrB domain-containing protein [Thermoanaerobaculia bacterium]|nr:chromate resistance protein ChrB domain-containing protein [Thermoanaerobaculia bacterium]
MSPVETVKKPAAKSLPRSKRTTRKPAAVGRPALSGTASPARWLLLVHQLPPRPPYLRAKIAQRLAAVGALPLKNSVYVLPAHDDCREDFEWLAQEATAGGGQAWIAATEWLLGTGDEALRDAFRAQSARAYDDLLAACREELAGRRPQDLARRGELAPLLVSFRARFERLRARDFFAAERGHEIGPWLDELATASARGAQRNEGPGAGVAELRGKVWVTRSDVFVDRIATAWLVRRFIDAQARFRFVDGTTPARTGQVRFDMTEAEITHEGDRCTFEVLLGRLGVDDPALRRLAEMVHDIDLRDARHGHPETAGLERMLAGLVALERRDARRLQQGFELFDRLYRALSELPPVATPKERRGRRSTGA